MMNLLEWLESPIGRIRAIDKKEMNIKMRLSELVGVNYGKIEITQVGKIEPGGPYGRLGLTLEEAFELATMIGCYSGFILALDDDESREVMKKAFHIKIQNQINEDISLAKGETVIMGNENDLKQAVEEEKKRKEVISKLRKG
jgi:hypothetical protein